MQPPPGRTSHLLAALALVLLVGAMALLPVQGQGNTDQARMEITLADPALGGASGAAARLDVEITSALRVAEDDAGRYVRVVMPQADDPAESLAAMNLHFFAPTGHQTNGKWQVETANGSQSYAVFRWSTDAPDVGSLMDEVILEATRTIRLNDMVTIIWPSHTFENVTLRIDLPKTHEALGSRLTPQAHNVPANRNVWTATISDPSVSAILRPTTETPDPAFDTYRPNAAIPWLIILALVAVSGGAWVLGKRLEKPPEDHEGSPPTDDPGPTRDADAPDDGDKA